MFAANGRRHGPPVVLGVLLVSSLVLRCASGRQEQINGRLARTDAAIWATGGQPNIFVPTGGASTGAGSAPATGGAWGMDFRCTPGAVEKTCQLSRLCADATTRVVFMSPACVDGDCQWTAQMRTCAQACTDGACETAGDASNGEQSTGAQCDVAATDAALGDRDAGGCELPPSVCIGSRTLLYFDNPRCEDGLCRAEAKARECSSGPCVEGACQWNVTR